MVAHGEAHENYKNEVEHEETRTFFRFQHVQSPNIKMLEKESEALICSRQIRKMNSEIIDQDV